MKVSSEVSKETMHISIGVLIGDALMLLAFFALKKLDHTVLLGALLGSVAAVGNFFIMGLSIQKAMNDPDNAKRLVQRSYALRMIAMVAIMIVGFVLPWFHKVAVVVPVLLPGLTIQAMRILGLYKPEQEGGGQSDET